MPAAGVSRLGSVGIMILLTLFPLALLWPHMCQSSPITAPEATDGRGNFADPSLLEQDADLNMQGLLETLRGQLLRTFNLSGLGPSVQPGAPRVEPPEYMLELYNRFANDHTAMPTANIVRSFKNEDSSPHSVGVGGVRKHPLLFNVSVPHHERITTAELRLYTLVQRDRRLYFGVDRKVTIFEVQERQRNPDNGHMTRPTSGVEEQEEEENLEWVELASRQVYDDRSGDHHADKRELNEMIGHESQGAGLQSNLAVGFNSLWDEGDGGFEEDQDEEALIQMRSNLIYDTASRIRRNAKGNQCKKTSLYVEFKDIGWDSWILAPTGYEAYECSGVCSYPLTKHVTPTKHAIVQTLVNMKSPQKVSGACCVPTKLDPISLLYLDDTGVVTYKYKYEGMVVAECGCR
ncbi:bone morphogenetic protein 10 isoform X2 [Scleropages formosus]|uniref:bone morphogenetic protein 10 isoform X2 n=1 Tax=Scleropages formosus TaxID=113540 RepID=UPI00087824A6|nr:bone morphogenetic protein 10 isoform X2 [Scleropages formosus]